jgi:hypothetical protein
MLRDCQIIYITVCVWVTIWEGERQNFCGRERERERAGAVNCHDSYLASSCYKFWEQLRSLRMTQSPLHPLDHYYSGLCSFSPSSTIHWFHLYPLSLFPSPWVYCLLFWSAKIKNYMINTSLCRLYICHTSILYPRAVITWISITSHYRRKYLLLAYVSTCK